MSPPLPGTREMSDLSPQSGPKRKLIRSLSPDRLRLICALARYALRRAWRLPHAQRAYGRTAQRSVGLLAAAPHDAYLTGVRRIGRSDVLWPKPSGPVSACRRNCRQDSARDEAGRHPSRAAEFDLIINLTTAKALGLKVPLTLQVA